MSFRAPLIAPPGHIPPRAHFATSKMYIRSKERCTITAHVARFGAFTECLGRPMQLLVMDQGSFAPYTIPPSAQFPLTFQFLRDKLFGTLPQAAVRTWFEWYPNTSDVLIASTFGNTVDELNLWSMQLIAVDVNLFPRAHKLLQSEGIQKVTEWFVKSDQLLHEDPSRWLSCSLTMRFENDQLLLSEHTFCNPLPRPEPGWPERPYRSHKRQN